MDEIQSGVNEITSFIQQGTFFFLNALLKIYFRKYFIQIKKIVNFLNFFYDISSII